MSSMSYCRFENTETDMNDCIEALTNREIKPNREKEAARRMLNKILIFLQEEDIIEDFNAQQLEKVINQCK